MLGFQHDEGGCIGGIWALYVKGSDRAGVSRVRDVALFQIRKTDALFAIGGAISGRKACPRLTLPRLVGRVFSYRCYLTRTCGWVRLAAALLHRHSTFYASRYKPLFTPLLHLEAFLWNSNE